RRSAPQGLVEGQLPVPVSSRQPSAPPSRPTPPPAVTISSVLADARAPERISASAASRLHFMRRYYPRAAGTISAFTIFEHHMDRFWRVLFAARVTSLAVGSLL